MQKDRQLKKFVHISCARAKQKVINQVKDVAGASTAAPQDPIDQVKDMTAACRLAPQDSENQVKDITGAGNAAPQVASGTSLPHGLSSSSLADYSKEWDRYLRFAGQQRDVIPGRDTEWDMQFVWEYLQFRSSTCKPETVKQILTKLAHFGARHKFILATSKYDGDPFAYRSMHKMKKQLAIDARAAAEEAGKIYEPVDRCTPIGRKGVGMILSSFQLTSEEKFNALSRRDRHHVAATMIQHTGGARFGGFRKRNYTTDSFVIDASGTLRLVTDWARYSGQRQFAIEFPASPRFESMWYHIHAPNGDLVDTYSAATVRHWHFRRLHRDGERHVFAPVLGETCTREERQKWIREVLYDALPISEREARLAAEDASPHSFRAGLAGDLYREGVSLQRIASICRWRTPRVVRIYAERPCLSASRLTNGFRLIERFSDL